MTNDQTIDAHTITELKEELRIEKNKYNSLGYYHRKKLYNYMDIVADYVERDTQRTLDIRNILNLPKHRNTELSIELLNLLDNYK